MGVGEAPSSAVSGMVATSSLWHFWGESEILCKGKEHEVRQSGVPILPLASSVISVSKF